MQKSWRHHYLPQFYLKGFTNEQGTFKMYDVKKGKFIKNGKEFSPKSVFFEKNGNTLYFPFSSSEYLEKMYQKYETPTARILKKINDNFGGSYGINEFELVGLYFFLCLLYYRLPHVKEITSKALCDLDFDKLKFPLPDEVMSKLKNNEEFKEFFVQNPDVRKLASMAPTMWAFGGSNQSLVPKIMDWKDCPKLISDNPFICEDENTFDVFQDRYIFPLNANSVLFRVKNLKPSYTDIRKSDIDLFIYKQAKKYVACDMPEYITALDDYYDKEIKSMDNLRDKIFQHLL